MNWELPDNIKAEEPEIKLPAFNGKQGNSRKTSISVSLTTLTPLTVWITIIPKEMGVPDHLTCLLQKLYAGQATVRTGHGTTDWFKTGKVVHSAYLTYMQSTSCKMLGWMYHKLEPRLPGKDWRQKARGQQRRRGLDSITNARDMNLNKLRRILEDRRAWQAAIHGVTKSQTWFSDWTTL